MVKIKEDREFIFAAMNGNPKAMDALIRKNEQLVRKVVRKNISDSFCEDDMVQEILLKAIRKLGTFQNESSFSTWLYRLSVNHVLDYVRKRKAITVAIPDTYCSETAQDEAKERKGLIYKYFEILILHMKDEYRVALILADIFNMQHQEAAIYLNITPLNFRKRLSRARLQMRILIDSKSYLHSRPTETAGAGAKEPAEVERIRLFLAKKISDQYPPSRYAA